MRPLMIAASLTLLLTTSTYASFYDGNTLFEHCSKGDDGSKAVCFGYIIGVSDGFKDASVTTICLPGNATTGQIQDTALLYIINHPSERHLSAAWMIGTALAEAFPC